MSGGPVEVAAGYLAGVGTLAVMVGPLWWAAVQLRRRLLAEWDGARAVLAVGVMVLSALLVISQALGSIGMFRRGPLMAAAALMGLSLGIAAVRRLPRPSPVDRADPEHAEGVLARCVAVGAVGGVGAIWVYRTAVVFDGGISEWDSLWYHLPFAARWVQLGSLTGLHDVGNPAGTFLPVNVEVFHALGMVAFGHDVLSPLLNLLWLVLLLIAAWAVGLTAARPWTTLTLGALVMGVRVMQESQPATANIDVAAVAFLLAAVVFAMQSQGRGPGVLLAGAAIGLVAGTKLTLLPVAAVLAVLLAVATPGRSRAQWLPAAGVVTISTGGFWYVRNLVRTGNPLPWMDLRLGSVGFRGLGFVPVDCGVDTVLDYATAPDVWLTWFVPGLRWAFGPGWWLLLAAGLAGGFTVLVRARSAPMRALGATALMAWVGYLITPASAGGTNGVPHCFSYNLRFLVPALTLSLVIVGLTVPARHLRAFTVGLAAVLIVTSAGSNTAGQAGAVVGVMLAVGAGRLARAKPARRAQAGLRRAPAVIVALALLAGLPATNRYLARRYVAVGFEQALGPAARWARDVQGARIALSGLAMHYPLYGRHGVDNTVEFVSTAAATADLTFARPADCDSWRQAIHRGGFTHVVTGSFAGDDPEPPQASWTRDDPRAREVLRDGSTAVFALDASTPPAPCE